MVELSTAAWFGAAGLEVSGAEEVGGEVVVVGGVARTRRVRYCRAMSGAGDDDALGHLVPLFPNATTVPALSMDLVEAAARLDRVYPFTSPSPAPF